MYRIVMVCTGNICRSPAMELLMQAGVDESVSVTSGGTSGLSNAPVSAPMQELLAADLPESAISGFASQFLNRRLVADADLILTATAEHRAGVLSVDPRALKRTLTLGEFARLVGQVPAEAIQGDDDATRFASLARAALAQRYRFQRGSAATDIADPYGKSAAVYEASYRQIQSYVTDILNALKPE